MNLASASAATWATPPRDVRGLAYEERDALVISTRTIDGRCIVLSRYGDERWHLVGQPTNKPPSEQAVNFNTLAPAWRATMKALLYRYLHRGREGQKRPSARAVVKLFKDARPFLQHLDRLGIVRLADVTPMVCAVYADACKHHRQPDETGQAGKPLKASSLGHRFGVVEALYELSQYADDAMAAHPWPGTSATHLAGLTGLGSGYRGGQTPVMPDEVFTTLFQRAWSLVEDADALLDLRDELLVVRQASGRGIKISAMNAAEHRFVRSRGWPGTSAFREALHELRTACYIIVASLSGCRNHELAFIEAGACYSSERAPARARRTCVWRCTASSAVAPTRRRPE